MGVDLGTNTGVAFTDIVPGQPVAAAVLYAGQWDLSLGPYDSGILRLVRLQQFLSVLRPDLVMYEFVRYTPVAAGKMSVGALLSRVSTAADLLGALRAILADWCHSRQVPCEGVEIGDVKKSLTGRGNASKADMIRAVNEKYGCNLEEENYETTGADNIADAISLCGIGVERYGEGAVISETKGLP